MAGPTINPTQITPPRVAFIDERSGAISREWYRFFLSLRNSAEVTQQEASLLVDANSLIASYDAMLTDLAQEVNSAPDSLSRTAALASQFYTFQNDILVAPPSLFGTVTSVGASGGTTGLTFTGSPITTSGTFTLGGTLNVTNGGTGVTTSTGTVAVVLSNTPTLVTPILGVASATSIATGLGAVGTPAYTFTGNTNTGIWSPATGNIAISNSGVETIRIGSSGNVGIGTTANASALLDVQSTTKGVRMPNMTTTQKNAISGPAAGLMVFDTTLAKLCVYSGAAWQTVTSV